MEVRGGGERRGEGWRREWREVEMKRVVVEGGDRE